jgi:hypothetical protein
MQQNLSVANAILSLVDWRTSVYRFIIYVSSSSIWYCWVSLQIQEDNFELVTGLLPYDLFKEDLLGEQIVFHSVLSIIDHFESIDYYLISNFHCVLNVVCNLLGYSPAYCV